jgi:hypothetical protein
MCHKAYPCQKTGGASPVDGLRGAVGPAPGDAPAVAATEIHRSGGAARPPDRPASSGALRLRAPGAVGAIGASRRGAMRGGLPLAGIAGPGLRRVLATCR